MNDLIIALSAQIGTIKFFQSIGGGVLERIRAKVLMVQGININN
jgi:hypothetical protein